MRNLVVCIFSLLTWNIISGCEEVINLDVDQAEPQLIIDGLLTDEDTIHIVRVTRSADFYGNGGENVTDAIVQVTDNSGQVFDYSHNPEGLDSLQGYYFSDQKYAARIFGIYQLNVLVNNRTYTARDTLRPVTTIDSLSVRLDSQALNDSDNNGNIYQVILYADEPQESIDFYYFKFYRDSILDKNNNVFVFDDKLLGNSLNGLPSPVSFKEGELATVEIYSLTRQQFVYFTDLANLLNSDGGMFSPPPANPRTNLTGGAIGLFQVSGISRGSIRIEL